MKLANFSASPLAQLNHQPTGYQPATYPYSETSVQFGVLSPATELVTLPVFALLLLLLFQGSRHLCFVAYDTLYTKYQSYRFSLQQRQVATLERILNTSSASRRQS